MRETVRLNTKMNSTSSFRSSIASSATMQSANQPLYSHSMSASSYGSTRRGQQNQNNDFTELNSHIDTVELSLTNLNSQIKQKSALFETEMGNIQNQIKLAKENFERELAEQKRQQEEEIAQIKQQQEEEIIALEANLKKVQNRKDEFRSSRSQVRRMQKEIELADLNHQLELLKIQQEDQTYLHSTNTAKTHTEKKQVIAELNAKIEMLDAEINDVTAARREEALQFKMKIDDANNAFEKRNNEFQNKLARYQAELAKRQKECEDHIAAIRNHAEMEEAQLTNELNATNEKVKGLTMLYTKLQNRGSQEIQTVKLDINELKSTIEKAKQREAEQIEETRKQIAKLRGAQHDSVALEQELLSLKQEIEDMRKENQDMRKERNRVETLSYTTRISKYRSASLH